MFATREETKYEALPQQEETSPKNPSCKDNRSTYLSVSLAFNFISVIVMVFYGWRAYTDHTAIMENTLPIPPTLYSPANNIIRYASPRPYDADIFQTNRWRGPAGENTDEIDLAWAEITEDASLYRLDEEDLRRLNRKDDDPLRPLHKATDEQGGGYVAQFEVFHLLHCLKGLRDGQFYNWDYYKGTERWNMSRKAVMDHNDHCLDVIRMNLMCYADVTPIVTYDPVKFPRRKLPVLDFSTIHSCRNFNDILEWTRNNPRSLKASDIGDAVTYAGPS